MAALSPPSAQFWAIGGPSWHDGAVPLTSVLLQRVLPLTVLAVAVGAVPVMALSPSGWGRLQSLREERERADATVATLSREIEQLRVRVTRIKNDPATVEQVARDELGLVRQTELVFQFK